MRWGFSFLLLILFHAKCLAHPMPGSVVDLFVLDKNIQGEARVPLMELQNAMFEQKDFSDLQQPGFYRYFLEHIRAEAGKSQWKTKIDSIVLMQTKDPIVGLYEEVVVYFGLTPSRQSDLRYFTFKYDAVIHQVVNHKILVNVQQDWYGGLHQEPRQLGVIELDIRNGVVHPFVIDLQRSSWWKGFSNMLKLGMEHIWEGKDHLLFILVLLLPSMLISSEKKWSQYGGRAYALRNLLRIVTAFTIGHSITLFLGAVQWVSIPQQPVEYLITVSIFLSAVHAIRPIFSGKEIFVASGFGLVHGLAFATVLAKMKMSAGMLVWSILGFNLGIEIMQLFIIVLIIPIFLLLGRWRYYNYVRIPAAVVSGGMAIFWMMNPSITV